MLKLQNRNNGRGCKRLIAALSAAALVFSGNSYISVLTNSVVFAQNGEYKTWKQSDPRWGGIYLGNSGQTISMSGCAITSLASLIVKAGYLDESEFNPGIFCEFLNRNGGFSAYGDVYWGTVSKLIPDFTFVSTAYLYGSTAEEKTAEIQSYLDQGYYIISDVRYSAHWVAIDRIENGIVYDIDPAGNTTSKMFEQYDFKGATRLKLFRKGGSSEPVIIPTVNYKTGNYITTAKLNFRTGANISSEKIDLIDSGVVLEVTEIASNWGKTEYNGNTGWICLDYTSETDLPVTPAPVITEAPAVTEPVITQPAVTETEKPAETTVPKVYVPGTYRTNAKLNYRENAGTSYPSFGIIEIGTDLSVSEISGNWGRTVYNEKDCWICLDFADYQTDAVTTTSAVTEISVFTAPVTSHSSVQAAVTEAPAVHTSSYVTGSSSSVTGRSYKTSAVLNLRTGAGITNGVICLVPSGTDVIVSETSGIWGKINYNDCTGWISLEYAVSNEENSISDQAVPVTTSAPETKPVTTVKITTSAPAVTSSAVTTQKPAVTTVSAKPVVTTPSVTEKKESEHLYGDVNNDGEVNAVDLYTLVQYILNNEAGPDFYASDVNRDGMVSSKDIVALKILILE